MKPNRNYITPFISLIFLVVSITGLLMLFHLFNGYTEVIHELLGVFFVGCAICHIILNWKALKIHFKKRVFLPALFATLAVSFILMLFEIKYPPVDLQIMDSFIKAPVDDALKILNISYEEAQERLRSENILIENAHTLEDLWIQNDADPEKIIDLLLE